jgi:putative flippase GtrA
MPTDRFSHANQSKNVRHSRFRRLAGQFSRFALVGLVGTAVHYGVMAFMIELLGIPPLPSSASGFISSAIVSYVLNYRITFSSAMDHRRALPRFLAVGTIGLGLNSLLVGTLTGPAHLHWLVAQVIASIIVLCWNFAANRVWTFSSDPI